MNYRSLSIALFALATMPSFSQLQAQLVYTTIEPPGRIGATAAGISGNNIVGTYASNAVSNSIQYGFLYNGATHTTIDYPSSLYTSVNANSGNNIIGTTNVGGALHAFLYDGTTYTPINPKGSLGATVGVNGISGSTIVGYYADLAF